MEQIRAVIYEFIVYDSISDYVHSTGCTIKELYVPEYNMSCNMHHDNCRVFVSDLSRYTKATNAKQVMINKNLVEKLQHILQCQQQIDLLKNDIVSPMNQLFQ
jgi:hypothetical protein